MDAIRTLEAILLTGSVGGLVVGPLAIAGKYMDFNYTTNPAIVARGTAYILTSLLVGAAFTLAAIVVASRYYRKNEVASSEN